LTPHDVGQAALFLANDKANFLTGVVMEVDAGRCIEPRPPDLASLGRGRVWGEKPC
jgi:enoyl-[acyl-carrier-protein] reductase (NADH)